MTWEPCRGEISLPEEGNPELRHPSVPADSLSTAPQVSEPSFKEGVPNVSLQRAPKGANKAK